MSAPRLPTARAAVGHGCVDVYQGLVPVLVPFLVTERGYDYGAVSVFVLAATLLSALAQPLLGLLADRWTATWLVPAGTAMAGAGVGLVGPAGCYPMTLAVIAVAGLGVAAYHPEAARALRLHTGGRATAMSWFSLGGNLGFAAAPVIAIPLLGWGGLAATPYLAVPALVGVALARPLRRRADRAEPAAKPATPADWSSFRWLATVTVLRSIVYIGLSTFVGLFVAQRAGGSAGTAILVLFAGGCAGTLLGGRLADGFGLVRTVRWAYALAVVVLAGVIVVPGTAVYALVFVTAAALYVPFSLHITLGQAYLPARTATASGVTLGLAVSAGGVFAPLVGALADATSLRVALAFLIVPAAAAGLFALRLSEPQRTRAEASLGG